MLIVPCLAEVVAAAVWQGQRRSSMQAVRSSLPLNCPEMCISVTGQYVFHVTTRHSVSNLTLKDSVRPASWSCTMGTCCSAVRS